MKIWTQRTKLRSTTLCIYKFFMFLLCECIMNDRHEFGCTILLYCNCKLQANSKNKKDPYQIVEHKNEQENNNWNSMYKIMLKNAFY